MELAGSHDLRALVQDFCQLTGVNPNHTQWLQSEAEAGRLEDSKDMQNLVSSLLLRMIGMEVSLP